MTSDASSFQEAQVLLSLTRLNGVDNRKALELYGSCANSREHLGARETFLSLVGRRTGSSTENDRAWKQVERQLEQTLAAGIHVIPFGNDRYPDRLRGIGNPPVVLFAKGEIDALHAPLNVAIVGTRDPTDYGRRAAIAAGKIAVESGAVVVSGLALGCDAEAHQGCVDSDGRGVAVLAHGLDRVYPAANRELAGRLLDGGGCLVSESPVGVKPARWAFAYRDRIQSGLSDCVLVIETDVKGGTMHTVKYSRQQGRPLGCINHPEQFLSASKTRGNQKLIGEGVASSISNQDEVRDFITGALSQANAELSREENGKEALGFEERITSAGTEEIDLELVSTSPSSEYVFDADRSSEIRPMDSSIDCLGIAEAPDPANSQALGQHDVPARKPDATSEEKQLTMALGDGQG